MPDSDGPDALTGWAVGVTAERRREEFGAALERRGATVVYGPAIRIVPLEDDSRARQATQACLAGPLDLAVVTTAVGFRGWLAAASDWGLGDRLQAALAGATILARGPKVAGAVRAAGLREAWSPESESSAEVLEYLLAHVELAGRRVVLQLHGDPLTGFVAALRSAGAEVFEVPVYRWEPPADVGPLHRLVRATAGGGVDVVTFTSAPAAENFLRTADELGEGAGVREALQATVLAAAVGGVTAAPLLRAGVPVVQPDRFRLGALVKEIVEQMPLRAVSVEVAGRRIELRGRAALVDGEPAPLPEAAVARARALVATPSPDRDAQLRAVLFG